MFQDSLHQQFAAVALASQPYGGADHGEIAQIAARVGDGDDDAFHDAWSAAAGRRMEEGQAARARGHVASAREAFLHAACFYAISYRPLFGEPVDARLLQAARRQAEAFDLGLGLGESGAMRLRIPFDGAPLPACWIPAQGRAGARGPLIVFTNGYDTSDVDLYFAAAVAASRRGYHSLIFDGPGQGAMLFEHGMRLRPDWETVIEAVLDLALVLPEVDPDRIALYGWSLGGHLAPRAAAFEPRLAACIADPAQIDIAGGFRAAAVGLGATPAQACALGTLPQHIVERMDEMIRRDRKLAWNIVRRGFWAHGVADLRGYLASVEGFTLAGQVDRIRCPMLVTQAENDPLAVAAQAFHDALDCPKTLLRFSRLDGAGGHCELGNRSLLNRRVLDWLDDVLA